MSRCVRGGGLGAGPGAPGAGGRRGAPPGCEAVACAGQPGAGCEAGAENRGRVGVVEGRSVGVRSVEGERGLRAERLLPPYRPAPGFGALITVSCRLCLCFGIARGRVLPVLLCLLLLGVFA